MLNNDKHIFFHYHSFHYICIYLELFVLAFKLLPTVFKLFADNFIEKGITIPKLKTAIHSQ